MDCREFRREAGADPAHLGDAAAAHLDECPACAEFLRQTLALDEKIRAALRVPVPGRVRAGGGQVVDGFRKPDANALDRPARERALAVIKPRRWLALAASIVSGVAIGSLLWVAGPRGSLAGDLVKHMGHEPGAMVATQVAASPTTVAEVLDRAGVRLRSGVGVVSYASTCPFRGDKVPHLVVQTATGPVTVMVLRHEQVARATQFDEGGYAGTIVPVGPGSIAVIGHQPAADLDAIARQLTGAVEWIPAH
jgi:hypothetical protein